MIIKIDKHIKFIKNVMEAVYTVVIKTSGLKLF